MKRYFEFVGEDKKRGTASSAKFWEIEVIDSEIRLRYGPIGKKGQITLKSYNSEQDAQAAAVKLIREKTNKGYEERGSDEDAETCSSCGTETLEGASFCVECGQPLHEDDDEEEPTPVPTSFEVRCEILAEFWSSYRDDEDWADFIAYNDLALPLAHLISNGMIESSDVAEELISECWDMFLEALEVIDADYESLDQLMSEDS